MSNSSLFIHVSDNNRTFIILSELKDLYIGAKLHVALRKGHFFRIEVMFVAVIFNSHLFGRNTIDKRLIVNLPQFKSNSSSLNKTFPFSSAVEMILRIS